MAKSTRDKTLDVFRYTPNIATHLKESTRIFGRIFICWLIFKIYTGYVKLEKETIFGRVFIYFCDNMWDNEFSSVQIFEIFNTLELCEFLYQNKNIVLKTKSIPNKLIELNFPLSPFSVV